MRRVIPVATIALIALTATSGAAHSMSLGAWAGTLPVSEEANLLHEQCVVWDACPELRGLLYDDFDIEEEMELAAEHMGDHGTRYKVLYEVRDLAYTFPLTSWRVCQYDEDHRLITCDQTYQASLSSSQLMGDVDDDAHHLRLLLKTNPGAQYHFRIVALQR